MPDETEKAHHEAVELGDGKWCAYLHGVLVTDLAGAMIVFDSEADAKAFVEESEARAASVDA